MILPLSNAASSWDHVLSAGSGGGGGRPVLVFAAVPDADALVAARTITALLRSDLVPYEVHPVGGYADLQAKFEDLVRGDAACNPRAALCINCGAGVDLAAVLGLGGNEIEKEGVKVFVFDSHRPYHLRNIASESVFMFDDHQDFFDTSGLPFDLGWEDEWGVVEDVETDAESEDESDSGSSSGEEDENSEGEEDDVQFDGNKDEGEGEEGDETPAGRKRRRSERRKRRRTRRRRSKPEVSAAEREERRVLQEYYAAAPHGMASASLAHNLAKLLRKASVETLWGGIVGSTCQYLTGVVVRAEYDDAVGYYRAQIAEVLGSGGTADDGGEEGPVANAGYGGMGVGRNGHGIVPSTEFRLDLVRHWTLHESLMCSSYTMTRMAAWRQTGKRRLQELLATLGIPLAESKQRWCYMKQECKMALDDRLARSVRRFDLGKDIQYDSFLRILPGHRGNISAADVNYAIAALLELEHAEVVTGISGTDIGGAGAGQGFGAQGVDEIALALKVRFWRAYDALDFHRSSTGLSLGLELAIMAQKVSASVAGAVLEHKQYIAAGPFRYVFLRNFQGATIFAHALLLKRLAHFLIEALVRQGAKDKPFIVIAPDLSRGVWLAVAVMTAGTRNDFGMRFRKAAEKNGSTIAFDGFDSCACEIADGQETEFIRYLHDIMV